MTEALEFQLTWAEVLGKGARASNVIPWRME